MIACIRTWNTANHLVKHGWDVTVVTPNPNLWMHTESCNNFEQEISATGIHRILTGHDFPMLVPSDVQWRTDGIGWFIGGICRRLANYLHVEAQAGWVSSVKHACSEFKPGDFDLILATGNPFISFRAARWLGLRLMCPYVLDYRDPWTGNPHSKTRMISRHKQEESTLLHECAAATVVSPSWADLIGTTFGVQRKMHVISNGYDPDMFSDIQPHYFDHFSVVYAGTLYPPKRVLDPVFKAFGAFIEESGCNDAKFHYYGSHIQAVQDAAERIGLTRHVVIHGQVSRKEALSAQKGAGLVIILASVDDQGTLADNGIVTGKVFDCMALGRPALVVAPQSSDLYTIVETAGGMRCFTGNNFNGMVQYFSDVASGNIAAYRNRDLFQWQHISRKLDSLLRSFLNYLG